MMARWRHVVKIVPVVIVLGVIFYLSSLNWTSNKHEYMLRQSVLFGFPKNSSKTLPQPPPSQCVNTSVTSLAMAALTVIGRRPLLVTFINDAYINITNNWLCHTRHVDHLHDNILILAQDDVTKTRLQKQWPDIAVESTHPGDVSLTGSQKFSTVGYVRIMMRRTELLNQLVQAGINFILFETDFIWYENPIPDFLALAEKEDLDLVGTKSSVPDQDMCGGFIYFRNRHRTRLVWQEVVRRMNTLIDSLVQRDNTDRGPFKQNEQRYLNTLLRKNWAGVRYGLVDSRKIVADGLWYQKSKAYRMNLRPKAVHNNFVTTTDAKVARFKNFNQWVLDDDGSCNELKVKNLLQT